MEEILDKTTTLDIGLLVGVIVAVTAFIIIVIVIAYKIYIYLKWRKFLKSNNNLDHAMQYPVTEKYNEVNHNRKLGYRIEDEIQIATVKTEKISYQIQ